MRKSDIQTLPEYFSRYINIVEEDELDVAFKQSLDAIKNMRISLSASSGMNSYAPGKWTIKEVLQHIIDTERILCYRTVMIARGDTNTAAGFDPESFAANSNAGQRPLSDILDELQVVRQSTIALFNSFNEEILQRSGINWKYEMSLLAMAFTLIGHQLWHFKLLHQLYL